MLKPEVLGDREYYLPGSTGVIAQFTSYPYPSSRPLRCPTPYGGSGNAT